jgi:hypothetical protein
MDAPSLQLIISPDPHTRREPAIAAWLSEKAELSQSLETRRVYAAMLERFRRAAWWSASLPDRAAARAPGRAQQPLAHCPAT